MSDAPMTMTEEQKRADIAGLKKVGVHSLYATTKFSELRQAPGVSQVADWCKSETFVSDVLDGQGLSLHSKKNKLLADEVFMATARAAYLRGIPIVAMGISSLVREALADDIDMRLVNARAVFIHPFYDSFYRDGLSADKLMSLNQLVCDVCINRRKAVFTVADAPLVELSGLWWETRVLERLAQQNLEIEV